MRMLLAPHMSETDVRPEGPLVAKKRKIMKKHDIMHLNATSNIFINYTL